MGRFFSKIQSALPIHLPMFIIGSFIIIGVGLVALFIILRPTSVIGSIYYSFDTHLGGVGIPISRSSVEMRRVGDQLSFNFSIDEDDLFLAQQFSRELDVNHEWMNGISISLDPDTLSILDPFLPAKSRLSFSDKKVTFSSQQVSFLQSALPNESGSFATGSAEIKVFRDENQMSVFINNPKDLIHFATESGKLNLSRKITVQLFSLADKIATIDLSLKNKSLEGEIVLK